VNAAVTLELDASDAFIVVGLRNGRLPILLPGSEENLSWILIPVECGHVKVPRIEVMDMRHAARLRKVLVCLAQTLKLKESR